MCIKQKRKIRIIFEEKWSHIIIHKIRLGQHIPLSDQTRKEYIFLCKYLLLSVPIKSLKKTTKPSLKFFRLDSEGFQLIKIVISCCNTNLPTITSSYKTCSRVSGFFSQFAYKVLLVWILRFASIFSCRSCHTATSLEPCVNFKWGNLEWSAFVIIWVMLRFKESALTIWSKATFPLSNWNHISKVFWVV